MDYRSEIFSDSWRAAYQIETPHDATKFEYSTHGRADTYEAAPNFTRSKPNSVLPDDFSAGLDPQYQNISIFENVNPQNLSLVASFENEDYFSCKAHSTAHLSPKSHRDPFSAIRKSSPPSIKDAPIKVTKRRPGRPSTKHSCETVSKSSISPTDAAMRKPHNQIERKYRHSLNAEMALLRLAVPKIAEWDANPKATLKPSKALVLASAVSYIQELEKERDALKRP